MVVNEFEQDDIFDELNQKFANVCLEQFDPDVSREIMYEDLFEYRDTLTFSTSYDASCQTALKNIRRYLTQNISSERIQTVIDLDILDKLNLFLTSGYDDLQYETAWTITNLAYGKEEHTLKLIRSGVIVSLMRCFETTCNFRVKSQTAWALANVSIEKPVYRAMMAQENLIQRVAVALAAKCEMIYKKLISAIHDESITKDDQGQISCNSKPDSDDVKDLTWSLANICRGGFKTAEHWEQYLAAFNAFSQCIHFDNNAIWSEACWGLSRILSNMYNNNLFFDTLDLSPKLCPRLVSLLSPQSRNQLAVHMLPVLQTISNFSSGPNEYIEILLNADLLNTIWWYMAPDTPAPLRRNAILTISNLAAGDEGIVRKVVYNDNIMQRVMTHVTIPGHVYRDGDNSWISSPKAPNEDTKEEWRIVKEALWVLSNITTLANDDCICVFLQNHSNSIKLLSAVLQYPILPFPICLKVVDVLIRIVERTSKIVELTPPAAQPTLHNPYAQEMRRQGVIPALKYLCQDIRSPELYEQAKILESAIMYSSQRIGDGGSHAKAFGLTRHEIQLPGPNVRRIVHGYEDGDVRLIENAISSITL